MPRPEVPARPARLFPRSRRGILNCPMPGRPVGILFPKAFHLWGHLLHQSVIPAGEHAVIGQISFYLGVHEDRQASECMTQVVDPRIGSVLFAFEPGVKMTAAGVIVYRCPDADTPVVVASVLAAALKQSQSA